MPRKVRDRDANTEAPPSHICPGRRSDAFTISLTYMALTCQELSRSPRPLGRKTASCRSKPTRHALTAVAKYPPFFLLFFTCVTCEFTSFQFRQMTQRLGWCDGFVLRRLAAIAYTSPYTSCQRTHTECNNSMHLLKSMSVMLIVLRTFHLAVSSQTASSTSLSKREDIGPLITHCPARAASP